MKSKQPAVRQFGQRSLPSSFLFKSSDKDFKEDTQSKPSKSSISLSSFLDRKLDKTNHKPIQEIERPFSSICSRATSVSVHEDTCTKGDKGETDFVPIGAVFQQFKNPVNEESLNSSVGCEVREFQLESATDGQDSRKRRNPFAVSTGDGRPITPSYLVVLGDDPKPKQKGREQWCMNKRPKSLYNHYANGRGWWDCNREGVDGEEVGCNDMWEGMGSTTLGGLEWH